MREGKGRTGVRRFGLVLFIGLLGLAAFPQLAVAAAVTCPDPPIVVGPPQNPKAGNTYTVNPAIDCVWGQLDGFENLNGSDKDAFLQGNGINDPLNGTPATNADANDERFNLGTWAFIGSTEGVSASDLTKIGGLSFSNTTNDFSNFSLDRNNANLSGYTTFVLGVKDGADPKWAGFLLDLSLAVNNVLSGTVSMTGGSFSHFALYGIRGTPTPNNIPETPVPEPASLLLLGSGLAVAGHRLRRRFQA